jgi:hypothetical protein
MYPGCFINVIVISCVRARLTYHVIPASGNELGNGPSLPLLVSLPLPPFPPILVPRPNLRHNAYSFKESDDEDYLKGQRRCNEVSYCCPSHMGGYDQGLALAHLSHLRNSALTLLISFPGMHCCSS